MTKVFVAKIAEFSSFDGLPTVIENELATVKNEQVVAAKRAAYGLLFSALNACGYDGERAFAALQKNAYGKPVCDGVEFSVSHSKTAVAAAVSMRPVGVDLETFSGRKTGDFSFALAQGEQAETAEAFLTLWTKKEAVFKRMGNAKRFQPKTFRADAFPSQTQVFSLDGVEYVLSVATDERAEIEIIKGKIQI